MRNFRYAIRQVFRFRTTNIFKLLSLTLGIAISGALMLKVAYDRSYDTFYDDVDRLNIVYMHYNINGKDHGFQRECLAPIALELKSKMPNVIAATRFVKYDYNWYVKDGEPVQLRIAMVDTSFFDVFGLEVISGNPKHILSSQEGMLLSAKTAQKLYPAGDYIGKQITREGKTYTIQGVYADMRPNSHLLPMEGLIAGRYREDWSGGDNSLTYFKTSDDATPEQLTILVTEILSPRFADASSHNMAIDFKVENIRNRQAILSFLR